MASYIQPGYNMSGDKSAYLARIRAERDAALDAAINETEEAASRAFRVKAKAEAVPKVIYLSTRKAYASRVQKALAKLAG